MDKVATFTGFAATTLWLSLAILTAGSDALDRNSVWINLVVAVLFLVVALLVLWRVIAVETTRRSVPPNEAIQSLLRVEAVTGAAMLLLGVTLLVAAASRVFVEAVPVFG
jgi:hypothetical protein